MTTPGTPLPRPRRRAAPKCGHCHDQPAPYMCACSEADTDALHHVCHDCSMSMVLSRCARLTDALERTTVRMDAAETARTAADRRIVELVDRARKAEAAPSAAPSAALHDARHRIEELTAQNKGLHALVAQATSMGEGLKEQNKRLLTELEVAANVENRRIEELNTAARRAEELTAQVKRLDIENDQLMDRVNAAEMAQTQNAWAYAAGRKMVQTWREGADVTNMLGALAQLAKAVGL